MSRIIINFDDDIMPADAMAAVQTVIHRGRVSAEGEAYCYATAFRGGTLAGVVVVAEQRKASDSFRVFREKS